APIEAHSLALEEVALRGGREAVDVGAATTGSDDAMPGDRAGQGAAQRAQRHPDRPGGARAAGEARDLSVGDDRALGHRADDPVDETEERPRLDRPPGGLHPPAWRAARGRPSRVVRVTSRRCPVHVERVLTRAAGLVTATSTRPALHPAAA